MRAAGVDFAALVGRRIAIRDAERPVELDHPVHRAVQHHGDAGVLQDLRELRSLAEGIAEEDRDLARREGAVRLGDDARLQVADRREAEHR